MSNALSPSSWVDLYRNVRDLAEASRGVDDAATLTLEPAGWPRTTGADAHAIMSLFDPAVQHHARDHAGLAERWRIEADRLARETSDTIAAPYAGNRSLWMTLSLAAAYLYQVGAPLPSADAWQGVARELADHPATDAHHPTIAQFPAVVTWDEMAHLQLRFFWIVRGFDLEHGPLLVQIPHTTNADVIQLAAYWQEQMARLGPADGNAIARAIRARWAAALDNVAARAKGGAWHAIYEHNAEFWRALLALAIFVGGSVGAPAAWACQLDAGARNASAGPALDYAGTDWIAIAGRQRADYTTLRGADVIAPGGPRVPRTTNADALRLAAYWSDRLAGRKVKATSDVSATAVLTRWRDTAIEVTKRAPFADPDAVYAKNDELWRAIDSVAIQLSVTAEAPSSADLAAAALAGSVAALPDRIESIRDKLGRALVEVGDRVTNAAAAAGVAVAKPLLLVAGGALGLFLLVRASRRETDRGAS